MTPAGPMREATYVGRDDVEEYIQGRDGRWRSADWHGAPEEHVKVRPVRAAADHRTSGRPVANVARSYEMRAPRPRRDLMAVDFDWSEPTRRRGPAAASVQPDFGSAPRPEAFDHPWDSPVSSDPLDAPLGRQDATGAVASAVTSPGARVARWGVPDPAPGELPARAELVEATPPGRRTVVITGRGAERPTPPRRGYDARVALYERSGFKPDRVAMWAVLLGLALLLAAATSSHAAVLHAVSSVARVH